MDKSIHLGDGAYVTFNHGAVIVTANHHDPHQATDTVCIEEQGMKALIEWYEQKMREVGS